MPCVGLHVLAGVAIWLYAGVDSQHTRVLTFGAVRAPLSPETVSDAGALGTSSKALDVVGFSAFIKSRLFSPPRGNYPSTTPQVKHCLFSVVLGCAPQYDSFRKA